jgi:hypothetical protein
MARSFRSLENCRESFDVYPGWLSRRIEFTHIGCPYKINPLGGEHFQVAFKITRISG